MTPGDVEAVHRELSARPGATIEVRGIDGKWRSNSLTLPFPVVRSKPVQIRVRHPGRRTLPTVSEAGVLGSRKRRHADDSEDVDDLDMGQITLGAAPLPKRPRHVPSPIRTTSYTTSRAASLSRAPSSSPPHSPTPIPLAGLVTAHTSKTHIKRWPGDYDTPDVILGVRTLNTHVTRGGYVDPISKELLRQPQIFEKIFGAKFQRGRHHEVVAIITKWELSVEAQDLLASEHRGFTWNAFRKVLDLNKNLIKDTRLRASPSGARRPSTPSTMNAAGAPIVPLAPMNAPSTASATSTDASATSAPSAGASATSAPSADASATSAPSADASATSALSAGASATTAGASAPSENTGPGEANPSDLSSAGK
jgi:hypothetical protein